MCAVLDCCWGLGKEGRQETMIRLALLVQLSWGWTKLGNVVKICGDILDKTIVRNNYMLGASFTDLQMILFCQGISCRMHTHTDSFRVSRKTVILFFIDSN